MTEIELAFLRAIEADPARLHKLAYADWLEEQGRQTLAHAYRWAASRDKHPALTGRSKHASWRRLNRRGKKPPLAHDVSGPIFDQISAKDRLAGKPTVLKFRSLSTAFSRLADALTWLRVITDVAPR